MKIITTLQLFFSIVLLLTFTHPSTSQTANLALNFDGVDDIVTITNNSAYNVGSGNFTMEAWVKLVGTQTTFPTVLSKRLSSSAFSGFIFMIYQGKIFFQIAGTNIGQGSANIEDGLCHHVAVVRNGSTVTYYVDGNPDTSFTNASQLINTTHPLWIGRDEFALSSTRFKGTINEVRYWNTARTQAQIQASKNVYLSGSETGLVGYWRMNDNIGQFVNDYTSANNDGYLGTIANADVSDPTYVTGCLSPCAPPPVTITSNGTNICSGAPIILSATTGTGYTYQWKLSGNNISGAAASTYSAATSGSYSCLVTVNGCSSLSNTIVITSSTPSLTISYTGNTVICIGSSKLLTSNLTSNGGTSPSYQWKLGGVNISGATSSTYNATQAGTYTLSVTNNQTLCTGNSSNNIALTTTNGAPAALITSSNTTGCFPIFLQASPTGTGITFQWQLNNANISGATQYYYYAPVTGSYKCIVTNSCGSSTSNTIAITITGSQVITASTTTTFCTGTVTLNAPYIFNASYQWLNNSFPIPGAVNSYYVASTAGIYSCAVTTVACGTINSSNSITVAGPAGIIANGPTEVCTGPISLQAFPLTNATYQWKLNGTNISGATSNIYSATVSGNYTCAVTNTQCGTTISNQVTCSVGVAPQVTLVPPVGNWYNYDFCTYNSQLIALPANAGTYNWYRDMQYPVSSGTDNILYNPTTAFWYVELVTPCGTTTSATAPVRDINSYHLISTGTGSTTICNPGVTPISIYPYPLAPYSYGPQWDSYQWKLNGVNIAGATNPEYYPTQSGYYHCIITNSCGTACCVDSTLINVVSPSNSTVTASGPLTFCQGQSVTLSVPNVAGSSYAWYKNNAQLFLYTNSITVTLGGTYKVRINNTCNTVYSADQVVTITQPITASLQANNPITNCNGGPLVLSATTGSGYIYQWYQNSVLIPGATGSTYNTTVTGNYYTKISTSNGCYSNSNSLPVILGTGSAAISSTTVFPVCENIYMTLSANGIGQGNTYQWKLNGVDILNASGSSYSFYTTSTGNYTVAVTNTCGTYISAPFAVTVTPAPQAVITPAGPTTFCAPANVVLNANTGAGITYQWYGPTGTIAGATSSSYTATVTGNYHVKETFTSSGCYDYAALIPVNSTNFTASITPAGPTFQCNGTVLLTATSGTGFTYQWRKSGVNISGATSSTYSASTTGGYSVVITGPCGISTSPTANVTILTAAPALTIYTNNNTTFCAGTYGYAFLIATSVTGYTYQWKLNGVNISGATTSSYQAFVAGSYTCAITNSCGTQTSNAITLTVNPAPAATINASGPVNFCQGGNVTLNANTGAGLTYQWKSNGVNIAATNSSYVASTGGIYTCIVTGTNGCTAISNSISVYVTSYSATITAAGSTTICQGSSRTLNANVGGTSYQWKKNGNNISGATSTSYNAGTAGSYTVSVTSSCGTVTSSPVVISVISNPTATISAGGPVVFCAGQNVVLTANTFAGVTYKWQKNNVNIAGANSQSYTATTSGAYRVKETANGCSKFSTSITVTVNCRIGDFDIEEEFTNSISLHPNPFSESATLTIAEETDLNNVEIVIVDILGKEIKRFTKLEDHSLIIEKENMLPGMYLIRINYEDKIENLKFIIE